MDLGPYGGFIVAAYAAALVILALLVVWVWIDHRVQSRALAALEGQGVTRRSSRTLAESTR
jgi:heme exporter protein D